MDVLLIDPPWVIENRKNLWRKVGSTLPSLGLAYIAAVLEKNNISVRILDCTAEKISLSQIPSRLRRLNPSYVGITATTPLIKNALKIAEYCKAEYPMAKIILGGIHPSFMPEEVLSDRNVDYVVRGEGEITMLEICQGKPKEKIPGLSYRKGGHIVHNKDRPNVEDLNSIPAPAYHLLPMKKYKPAIGNYRRLPAMSIFATRGCPGRCTFCQPTFGRKLRARSAQSIISEIRLLKSKYGIKEINFYDDTFTAFRNVVFEFCDALIMQKIDITWSCFTRPDFLDEKILGAMKRAGCHLILMGIESADEQILKNIKKAISLEHAKAIVRAARKIGIDTRCSFMLGNPGETEETIRKTIDFALELDPDEVQFNITTAYPGTEMFEWADSRGYISTKDWSRYNMSETVMDLPTISQEKLKMYYKAAHKKFYLRPRIILRRLLKIRNFAQLSQELRGFAAVLGI